MKIVNRVRKEMLELGDVVYNKTSDLYMRIISHQGKYTVLFLDTFTASSSSYNNIDNLLVNYFEDDDIIVYKKNDMELILK